jgi:hypothetical protein
MPYTSKFSQHDAPLCMTVAKADRFDGLLSTCCARSYTIRCSKVETMVLLGCRVSYFLWVLCIKY